MATPVRDHTRTRILDVALELIAEQGFAATTTRELSERLGFTKAALYYHFRTKDDLLAALVTPVLDGLTALTESSAMAPTAAARRAVLADYIDLVATHENLVRVLSEDPSVAHRAALTAATPLYERLTQLLAGDEHPDTTARTRVRVALGGVHTALLRAEPHADRDVVRAATLAAACGALGIPTRRTVRSRRQPSHRV